MRGGSLLTFNMDSHQLLNILKKSPCGDSAIKIVACDELPSSVPKPGSAFVVNTKDKNHVGEHWIAFFTAQSEGQDILYGFDSLGFREPVQDNYSQFLYFIKLFKPLITNDEKSLQHKDFVSTTCGLFCIYFLAQMCEHGDFDRILNTFKSSTDYNECLVLGWMYSHFREDKDKFNHTVGCRLTSS
jgi:Adenovirus endoprotease